MKQKSFFSQLYYSGCSPSLIIEQLKSGIITESDIKKSSVKDFVQYLSSMTENVPHKEQEKINELMDIYIQDNNKIYNTIKIKGKSVSFLGYLLKHVPLTTNNLNYIVERHKVSLDNTDVCFLTSHLIKDTNFSRKHKSNLLLFLNTLNINLARSTIQDKKNLIDFYFNTLLEKNDDLKLKSFINIDLTEFQSDNIAMLFQIIENLPASQLKNKYYFIQDEIAYVVKKFKIIMDNAFDNIKKLCIQDEHIFRNISSSVNDNSLNQEDACANFCQFYLFNFMYEKLSDKNNKPLLTDFINTINSFSDSFHLNILDTLHSYIYQPLKFQINSDFIDIEKQNKIKKDKEEKLLPLFNYLKIKEEQIKIKESIKDFEKTPKTQKSKKRI